MLEATAVVAAIILLMLVNLAGVALTAFQLPGTWLMIATTAVFAWWRWGADSLSYGWAALATLLGLALLGELIEFAAGAVGSSSVGGSKRGALISILTALVGAILGSFLIPIPIVGTLLGAALGAGIGAGIGDKWAGRSWRATWSVFKGAAVGKLSGAVAKLMIAGTMWIVAAVTLFW
ncbi:MAG: DUF456 family protein [Planctomycetota bacterium]